MLDPVLMESLWQATVETFYMVGISALLAVLFGLPLGLLLVITAPSHILPNSAIHKVLGSIVNVGRSRLLFCWWRSFLLLV
jgi:D-methionine transport system permease protein